MNLTRAPGAFHSAEAEECWRLYRHMTGPHMANRAIDACEPGVGVTEHPLPDGRRVAALINYTPMPIDATVRMLGWRLEAPLHGPQMEGEGDDVSVPLPANDAAVWMLSPV